MWAEKGGLDFEGRARWDAWTAVKASVWMRVLGRAGWVGRHRGWSPAPRVQPLGVPAAQGGHASTPSQLQAAPSNLRHISIATIAATVTIAGHARRQGQAGVCSQLL